MTSSPSSRLWRPNSGLKMKSFWCKAGSTRKTIKPRLAPGCGCFVRRRAEGCSSTGALMPPAAICSGFSTRIAVHPSTSATMSASSPMLRRWLWDASSWHSTRPVLLSRRITRWVDIRTRYFGLPYGDQGLFCRRESFEKVGGFRKAFLMEDVDFVRSMRSLGNILVIPETITASPERYLKGGIIKNSLRNHLLLLLYRLGVDDRTLYSLYYRGQ